MSHSPLNASDLIVPPLLPPHSFTLPNGLTTHVQPDRRSATVCIHLRYHVGSVHEPLGHSGLSHVLEHMLFEGSSKVPQGEYARIVHSLGGDCNAETQDDATVYMIKLPAVHLELALELLADGMMHANLDAVGFARAKEAVLAERRLKVDNRSIMGVLERHATLAYPDSPYGRPTYGRLADLEHMTLGAVRVWYRNHYAPNNATLVVVGDVDPARVEAWVDAHFGRWEPIPLIARDLPRYQSDWGERREVLTLPQVRNCLLLSFNVPTLATADAPETVCALLVIEALLAGGGASVLHDRLVSSAQIMTGVTSEYKYTQRGDAVLSFKGYLAPGVTPEIAENALLDAVESLKRTPVQDARVEAIKLRLLAAYAEDRMSLASQAKMIGTAVNTGSDPAGIAAHLRRVAAVSQADIQDALSVYLVKARMAVTHVFTHVPDSTPALTCGDLAPPAQPVDLSALQAAPPPDKAAPVPTGRSVERWVTAQGASVCFVASPGTGLVSLRLRFRAGAHHDADSPGLAAITLYMLDQGCDGMDAVQFAQALEALGARYSRDLSYTYVTVSLHCPSLPTVRNAAMGLMAACCGRPSVDPQALERIRRRMLNYLSHREADVANRLDVEQLRSLYEAPSFAGDYRGERSCVAALQRQQVIDFHQRAYTATNLELALVADLTREQAERWVGDLCSALPEPITPLPALPPIIPRRKPRTLRIETPSSDAATANVNITLSFAVDIQPDHPDYPALIMVDHLLGGGQLSRLFVELRDRRSLTYHASSRLVSTPHATLLAISWDVRPQYAQASTSLVWLIIRCLIGQGPNEVDMELVRQQLMGNYLARFGDDKALIPLLADINSLGWPADEASQYSARLAQVTPADVQAIAQRVLDPARCAVIHVGPTVKQASLPPLGTADH